MVIRMIDVLTELFICVSVVKSGVFMTLSVLMDVCVRSSQASCLRDCSASCRPECVSP